MGEPREHEPVLLIVAAFTGIDAAFEWTEQRLSDAFGPIAAREGPFPFEETAYYEASMGPDLKFRFFAFGELIRPEWLAIIKRFTNDLEAEYAAAAARGDLPGGAYSRPINLDPGYLHHGKWIMATTKDQRQRVYLGHGIYADPMLYFAHGQWEPWPWTYPNYRRVDYLAAFARFRTLYLDLRRRWLRGELTVRTEPVRCPWPENPNRSTDTGGPRSS